MSRHLAFLGLLGVFGLVALPQPAAAGFRKLRAQSDSCVAAVSVQWSFPPSRQGDSTRLKLDGWEIDFRSPGANTPGARFLQMEMLHTSWCHAPTSLAWSASVGFGPIRRNQAARTVSSLRHAVVEHEEGFLAHRDHYTVVLRPPTANPGKPAFLFVRGEHEAEPVSSTVSIEIPEELFVVGSATVTPSYVGLEVGPPDENPAGDVSYGTATGMTVRREKGKQTAHKELPPPPDENSRLSNFRVAAEGSPETVTTAAFLGFLGDGETLTEVPLVPATSLLGTPNAEGRIEVRVPLLRPARDERELHVFVDLTQWTALESLPSDGDSFRVVEGEIRGLTGLQVFETPVRFVPGQPLEGRPFNGQVRAVGSIVNSVASDVTQPPEDRAPRAAVSRFWPWMAVLLALVIVAWLVRASRRQSAATP